MNDITTLTDFIIKEEHQFHNTTGQLTLLLTHLENCGKIIASHVKKSGLSEIMGLTGGKNAYGDHVQKLDQFANELLVTTLLESGLVSAVASEELEQPQFSKNPNAKYMVFIDPIDGSGNIDTNMNVGTIFSIYKKNDTLLCPGNEQIAAGYILYGSSVMFVYSCGQGVNGFTLDPSIGSFILSHPNINIAKHSEVYSINEGYYNNWEDSLKKYIDFVKTEKTFSQTSYKLRYSGCMIADIHRIFLEGGIFIYARDKKNPEGKLRLMYEVNPVSYLIEQAQGRVLSDEQNPLDILPTSHEQQVPFIGGSSENIAEYLKITKGV